jgi:integrase
MIAHQVAATDPFLACMKEAGIPPGLRPRFDEDAEDNLEAYVAGSAPASLAAFRADIVRWIAWAAIADVDPLNPRARQVRDFVQDYAGNRKPQTIKRMLSAIGVFIEGMCGNKNVTRTKLVKAEMKRIRRERGSKHKQALAIRQRGNVMAMTDGALPFSIEEMIRVLEPDRSLSAARAKFLLSLGGDTGRRNSEYRDANFRHLQEAPDGTGVFEVDRSKTDQAGKGLVRFACRRTMRLGREWREALDAAGATVGPDFPIFVAVDRHGNPGCRGKTSSGLSLGGFNLAVRGAVRMALTRLAQDRPDLTDQIDEIVTRVSGHSFRVGMVEDFVTAGE